MAPRRDTRRGRPSGERPGDLRRPARRSAGRASPGRTSRLGIGAPRPARCARGARRAGPRGGHRRPRPSRHRGHDRPGPVSGPAVAYRHALLRDAGYASLARAERALLHLRLARWLEVTAGARADSVAAAIAAHWELAVINAPALAVDVGDGVSRADARRVRRRVAGAFGGRGAPHRGPRGGRGSPPPCGRADR